jgi:hypothetical protein
MPETCDEIACHLPSRSIKTLLDWYSVLDPFFPSFAFVSM